MLASFVQFLLGKFSYLTLSSTVILVLFIFSYYSHPHQLPVIEGEQDCHLSKVIDGDTVELVCPNISKLVLVLRLQDIDAPEMGQGIWGKLSRQKLIKLAPTEVTVKFQGKDIYQRHLGILKFGDTDINEMMLKKGMARVYKNYRPPKKYLAAMASAKSQQLGIWSKKGLQQNPKRYRRLKY